MTRRWHGDVRSWTAARDRIREVEGDARGRVWVGGAPHVYLLAAPMGKSGLSGGKRISITFFKAKLIENGSQNRAIQGGLAFEPKIAPYKAV